MLLHLRWQPRPWLLAVTLVTLLPAVVLWTAALADSLGFSHVLAQSPLPAVASSRTERLLLMDTFLLVTLAFPVFAALASLLAMVFLEVRVASWEISARMRLPRPPWSMPQVVAAMLLLAAALLFVAMAGHLVADCVIGTDCVSG